MINWIFEADNNLFKVWLSKLGQQTNQLVDLQKVHLEYLVTVSIRLNCKINQQSEKKEITIMHIVNHSQKMSFSAIERISFFLPSTSISVPTFNKEFIRLRTMNWFVNKGWMNLKHLK